MTYIFERPVQTFEYEDIFRLIKLIYSQDRSISNLKRIESIARCAAEGIKNPFFPRWSGPHYIQCAQLEMGTISRRWSLGTASNNFQYNNTVVWVRGLLQ